MFIINTSFRSSCDLKAIKLSDSMGKSLFSSSISLGSSVKVSRSTIFDNAVNQKLRNPMELKTASSQKKFKQFILYHKRKKALESGLICS